MTMVATTTKTERPAPSTYDVERAKKHGIPMVTATGDHHTPPAVYIANHGDWYPMGRTDRDHDVMILQSGAIGTIWIAVIGSSAEGALETAAELLLQIAPGHFHQIDADDLAAAREDLAAEGKTDPEDHEIHDHATTDLTYTESGYLASWEWWIGEADPDLAAKVLRKCRDLYIKAYGPIDPE